VTPADRAYRLILRAYPAAFRAAYGREMALLFRDLRHGPGGRGIRFWAATAWDVARSAPALRLEAARARWTSTEEGEMMPMGILAIMIGALQVAGGLQEAWVGGMLRSQSWPLMGGTMGTVAGGLLFAAGVALLRRSPGAAQLARGAATTCMAVFVLIGFVKPLAGGLAVLLGIGFPIVLLLFLRYFAGRDLGDPTTI